MWSSGLTDSVFSLLQPKFNPWSESPHQTATCCRKKKKKKRKRKKEEAEASTAVFVCFRAWTSLETVPMRPAWSN